MIDGRPSATALLVALSVAREGTRHGLPPDSRVLADTALAAAGGFWRLSGWLARHAAGRALLHALESVALPGLAEHHCRRKAWLWQHLLTLPHDHRTIWLGVGFDALALALQTHRPDIACVETDHSDTLALRRRLIDAPHRNTEALHLPGDAERLLRLCRSAPATLITEGLLMYLPPRPLLRLFRHLSELPSPPRLLFSALQPSRCNGRGFAKPQPLRDSWLLRHGEPFRWRLPPERLSRLLQRSGYVVDAAWDGVGFGEYLIAASHRSLLAASGVVVGWNGQQPDEVAIPIGHRTARLGEKQAVKRRNTCW